MKQKRDSFVFYRSFIEAVDQAPLEEQPQIYKCIYMYALDGVEPDQSSLSTIGRIIWMMAKPQLDKNWERYLNALKGGAPKGFCNNPNGRRGTNQKQTKNKPNVHDCLNANESSIEDKKESAIAPKKNVSFSSLQERQKEFIETLKPFVEIYDKDMVNEFYAYWSEPNRDCTKMRFELEKTWEVSRRLAKWKRKEDKR